MKNKENGWHIEWTSDPVFHLDDHLKYSKRLIRTLRISLRCFYRIIQLFLTAILLKI